MTYDKDAFLAGIAVGRQLKGWATAQSLSGIVRTGTGGKELVNMQGSTEHNYVLAEVGLRYVPFYVPEGRMYVFAAALEPFTFRVFSNDREETGDVITGTILYKNVEYNFAHTGWYSPLPTPTIICNEPPAVMGANRQLSNDMVVTLGMLTLNL